MRQKFLTKLGHWAGTRTWGLLAVVAVITVVCGFLAGRLEMSMDLTSLLPRDDPMVDEFNTIFEEFNGASTIFIAVQGDLPDMVAFAADVSPRIREIETWIREAGSEKVRRELRAAIDKVAAGKISYAGRYIDRVEYRQPLEFIRDHGLMLVKPEDLRNTRSVYTDPNLLPFLENLNHSLEQEYIYSEQQLSTSRREFMATLFLDGIESWVDLTAQALLEQEYDPALGPAAAEAVLIGTPYLVSPDRSMLLMMVQPTFGILEMDHLLPAINGIEELVKQEAPRFHVQAGLAGGIVVGRDEYVAGIEDSMSLTLLALVLVLILFVVAFRMVSAPLLAGLNLMIGIVWAMGLTWLLVDTLNLFTAMMAVVLVGLGIDFSIHIISVYSEYVNRGLEPRRAIIETLQKVGNGIITGGFTTAAAFLTLLIGRSAGVSEFGLVCGMGLIMIMLATLLTLPTLIMLRERYRTWRGKHLIRTREVSYLALGRLSQNIFIRWKFSLAALFMVTLFFGLMLTRVTFDYNYLNMEPAGLESIRLNDEIIEKFNFSSEAALMTAATLEENHAYTLQAHTKSSISYVESLTDYLPIPAEQARRRTGILEIARELAPKTVSGPASRAPVREVLAELERLEANVIEMQDMAFLGGQDLVDTKATRLVGNPDHPELPGRLSGLIRALWAAAPSPARLAVFQHDFGVAFRELVLDMADTNRITLDMLPAMIRGKYISKNGDRYLLSLYPRGDVWNIDYLEVFTREVMDISRSIAGTPPMFYYLLKIIGADGKRAALLTLGVVFLLLWVDFKSPRQAALAMTPLLIGVVWMVGLMGLTGIQLTLLNVMAIPLIIGIGIDDGVHLMHRDQIEGRGAVSIVFSSTGKAIIITSLTTMLAFGSLVFATYRGFGSLGLALFLGVGTCLLASLLVLPALLGFLRRNS